MDPYPDPDPDPSPDPTPFFINFKDAKKDYFHTVGIFFPYNLPVSSVLKILFFSKILCKTFYFASIISVTQHLYEKGKDPEPDPDL